MTWSFVTLLLTRRVARTALCITGLLAAVVSMAAESSRAWAHEIPWRAGQSRQVGFGSCAKGACAKRTCWSASRPHRHVGGKVIMDTHWNSSCERSRRRNK